MEKLKIAYRIYSNGRGNPTESYILTDANKSIYRVSVDDAIKLCKLKHISARCSTNSKCLIADYKFKSVKFEQAVKIGYIKANDLISLITLKSSKVIEMTTVRVNNKGIVMADAAIVEII